MAVIDRSCLNSNLPWKSTRVFLQDKTLFCQLCFVCFHFTGWCSPTVCPVISCRGARCAARGAGQCHQTAVGRWRCPELLHTGPGVPGQRLRTLVSAVYTLHTSISTSADYQVFQSKSLSTYPPNITERDCLNTFIIFILFFFFFKYHNDTTTGFYFQGYGSICNTHIHPLPLSAEFNYLNSPHQHCLLTTLS